MRTGGRVRTCGDMTWALREMPGTDELMEYESRVNIFTQQHDCTLMCVYDVNKFSGRAVMDVLADPGLGVGALEDLVAKRFIDDRELRRPLRHAAA